MGIAKREMERGFEMKDRAIEIMVRAGVLKQCPRHGWLECTGKDIVSAYKLGNYKRVQGDRHMAPFEGGREMTDVMKSVWEESLYESCPLCEKD